MELTQKQQTDRKWYLKNRQRRLASARRWQQAHKEQEKMRHRRYRLKYPSRVRAIVRRVKLYSKYGLTISQFDSLNAFQESLCAICGEPQSKAGKSLAVDHCHKTGRIRGLLCDRCNLVLGNVGDSTTLLTRMIEYLEVSPT